MESCDSVCNKKGLICSEKEFDFHNNEVDSSDKVLNLIEKLGGTTSATSCVSTKFPASPLFNHKTLCSYWANSQPLAFNCSRIAGPPHQLNRRICYCTRKAIASAAVTGIKKSFKYSVGLILLLPVILFFFIRPSFIRF